MATVLTEGRHAAEFLLEELGISYSRDNIVIASGAGVIEPGTVLGKVTASGKFIPSPAATVTGKEGAEVGAAINLYRIDATAADVTASAVVRGATVNGKIISYDTSVNTDPKKLAKNAELKAAGIVVR